MCARQIICAIEAAQAHNFALHVEKSGENTGSSRQGFHIIRHQPVEKLHSVFATDFELGGQRQINDGGGVAQGVILRPHIAIIARRHGVDDGGIYGLD